MGRWADIDTSAQPTAGNACAIGNRLDGAPPKVVPRLRRADRLVVGSIDVAAHILQRRARDVLLGAAALMLPMAGLHLLLTLLAFNQFERFESLFGERGYVGVETGVVMVGVAMQSLTAHLVGAYTTAYVVSYQMGATPRVGACLLRVLRRLPLLAFTWLLTHWFVMLIVWWLAASEPAVILGLIWILPVVMGMLAAATLLVTPVVMAENVGVRAVTRAWRLVRLRFSAAFGFVSVCALLGAMLAVFIAFLPPLAESTGFITFGSLGWLFQGITSQLAVLIVMPFTAIATSQIYLQLRIHAEGLDIAMAADRAFGVTP